MYLYCENRGACKSNREEESLSPDDFGKHFSYLVICWN